MRFARSTSRSFFPNPVPEVLKDFDVLIVLFELFLCHGNAAHEFAMGFCLDIALDIVFYKFSDFEPVDSGAG